jgi:hypothetical protein
VYVPTPGSASLSINEQAKYAPSNGSYYREITKTSGIVARLSTGEVSDEAYLIVGEGTSESFDPGIDCPKMLMGDVSLSISWEEERVKLGQLGVDEGVRNDRLLSVYSRKVGRVVLSLEGFGGTSLSGLFLIDQELGKAIDLSKNNSYEFEIKETDIHDPARFLLSRNPLRAEKSFLAYPNPVQNELILESGEEILEVELFTVRGERIAIPQVGRQEAFNQRSIDMSSMRPGMYLIRLVTRGGISVKKVIKN